MRGLLDRGRAATVTIALPCRSNEPALKRTMEALVEAVARLEDRGHEVRYAICVNGPTGPASLAAEEFACGKGRGRTRVLTLPVADKAAAWNRLRSDCDTEWIVFCDADVEPAPDSLVSLCEALETRPDAVIATARLEPILDGGSFVARAAALPHRFDFGVVRGPMYVLRREALVSMPEGLLLEDAWLSAQFGASGGGKVLSVWSAVVHYRPPGNLRDYCRERLRTEAGKIQIRSDRRSRGVPLTPIARYPWSQLWSELGPRDLPLVALNIGVRGVCRFVAELSAWRGREVSWKTVESTKAPVAPGSPPPGTK